MPELSPETQLALVNQRLDQVLEELGHSKRSREKQYEAIDELKSAISGMANRMENVEKKLASTEPTITEFVAIKNKVVGAGAVGRWLWLLLGIVLGAIVTGRLQIQHLFKGT